MRVFRSKLRAQLGLKPLQEGKGASQTSSDVAGESKHEGSDVYKINSV